MDYDYFTLKIKNLVKCKRIRTKKMYWSEASRGNCFGKPFLQRAKSNSGISISYQYLPDQLFTKATADTKLPAIFLDKKRA
ncbi:MAG: hypothetical protein RL427_717 [Bacteroidota bacterium]|jgi:hypothetical protein